MPLAACEGLYVFFKPIRALNESLRIVRSWDSFPRASWRTLWIAKVSAENMELEEVILYLKTSLSKIMAILTLFSVIETSM